MPDRAYAGKVSHDIVKGQAKSSPNHMNAGVKRKRNDFGKSTDTRPNGGSNANKRQNMKAGPSRSDEPFKNKGKESLLSDKHRALLKIRSQLPIWPHASEIRLSLHDRDVLLLVGETGSGKSTQVPQFLQSESWCSGCIAITQPRRVAAISLARRVAEEMGTPLGSSSPSSKVGYSVRFDNNVSPSTKIKFLTEGMLLQEMLRDPHLTQYSAVIVDEVHERGVNVDLILGFLRNIVAGDKKGRKGVPLKTVVMSATADTESLFRFFNEGFTGQTNVVKTSSKDLPKHSPIVEKEEDTESSWSGISSSDEEKPEEGISSRAVKKTNGVKQSVKPPSETPGGWIAGKGKKKADTNGLPISSLNRDNNNNNNKNNNNNNNNNKSRPVPVPIENAQKTIEVSSAYISTCFIKGRQHPVDVLYTPEASQDFADTALKTIFQIHYKEPLPGDILVFLTGQETIEYALKLVNELAAAMGPEVPKVRTTFSSIILQLTITDSCPTTIRCTTTSSSTSGIQCNPTQHAKSHPVYQHCRDISYHFWHSIRHRQRIGQGKGVPKSTWHGFPPSEANFKVCRHSAKGSRWS